MDGANRWTLGEFFLATAGSSGRSQFPFPWEGVAEGRGRGFRSGRQAAACHKEFWYLYYYPALRAPLL